MQKRNKGSAKVAAVAGLPEGVGLRKASLDDFDFAFCTYRETMKDYSAEYILWNDEKQRSNLMNQWAVAEVSMITFEGAAMGWMAIQEGPDRWVLGHLYLKPQFQKRSIGSAVLEDFLARADLAGKAVDLAVLKNNPARRLYERAGFAVVNEDAMKYLMRRAPAI